MREGAGDPRWRGQPGRLEVWYATATDTVTGTGLWLHHERVAPVPELNREPYSHGWIAIFAPGGVPMLRRFGPDAVSSSPADPNPSTPWLVGASTLAGPDGFEGAAGGLTWSLRFAGDETPIWTMPRRMWERELLPAAQVVAAPRARFRGSVTSPDGDIRFDGVGGVAHIYGHGNARRWAWLHADLDEVTTLEAVVAVGRHPAMRWLPPLSFVQLRRDGHDWPRNPLAAAPLFRARLGLPDWRVRGFVGDRRLTVDVSQPPARCVTVDYTDPDGAHATCTNSEIADVDVRLERLAGVGRASVGRGRIGRGWQVEGEWSLRGTAHAERGYRD